MAARYSCEKDKISQVQDVCARHVGTVRKLQCLNKTGWEGRGQECPSIATLVSSGSASLGHIPRSSRDLAHSDSPAAVELAPLVEAWLFSMFGKDRDQRAESS